MLLLDAPLFAQQNEVTPQVTSAVGRGLAFLAAQQHPDGSLDDAGRPRVAVTGLGLMAMLATGNVPDEGKYGPAARAALDWLVRIQPSDGYYGQVDGSRMYGHGIVTLALAEAIGVETDPVRRRREMAALRRAVDVIFKAQDVPKDAPYAGGWRYEPQNEDSDLSLSGWNAMALRAAQGVGVDVPAQRVQRAIGFVLRCYSAKQGGFGYQPGREASIAMSGVGALNLFLLGGADHPEAATAAKFLADHPVDDSTPHPFYSMYYATQAAYQAGKPVWPVVWPEVRSRLLAMQNADGSWPPSANGEEDDAEYSTSMALATLGVPYRMLAVYQR